MVQSVELLLDDSLDTDVRREWSYLAELGLPSQQRHTGSSNRPHVTVAVAEYFSSATEDAITDVCAGTSLPLRLGGLIVFGGSRAVLARVVVPSTPLLDLHRELHGALGDATGVPPHLAPGRYTPHVTLAMRMSAEQVGVAIRELSPHLRDLDGTVSAVRRWDGEAKADWIIG